VVVGDRIVGEDPDANIRSELLRDAYVSEN